MKILIYTCTLIYLSMIIIYHHPEILKLREVNHKTNNLKIFNLCILHTEGKKNNPIFVACHPISKLFDN